MTRRGWVGVGLEVRKLGSWSHCGTGTDALVAVAASEMGNVLMVKQHINISLSQHVL